MSQSEYFSKCRMSHPPIGFHCGTGDAPRGAGLPGLLTRIKASLPSFTAAQIFASSPKSFFPCAWSKETRELVKAATTGLDIELYIHAPYIINPCTEDTRSIEALLVNLLTAGGDMGARGVVLHVGKSLALSSDEAMRRMLAFCDRVLAAAPANGCRLLIETCAGQGTEIARNLAVFGAMVRDLVERHGGDRIGACVDTCHVFAAGYDVATLASRVHAQIGWEHVHLIHLNDSEEGCGARKDRHANIGEGKIGAEALGRFCVDAGAAKPGLAFVLETPESMDGMRRVKEMAWFLALFSA
jgi:deoxyribonuclease-4